MRNIVLALLCCVQSVALQKCSFQFLFPFAFLHNLVDEWATIYLFPLLFPMHSFVIKIPHLRERFFYCLPLYETELQSCQSSLWKPLWCQRTDEFLFSAFDMAHPPTWVSWKVCPPSGLHPPWGFLIFSGFWVSFTLKLQSYPTNLSLLFILHVWFIYEFFLSKAVLKIQ